MGVRDALLAAQPPTEAVDLPELGITVTVRGLTGTERDAFEESCMKQHGKRRAFSMDNIRAKLVAFCCLEEDGSRAFSDAEANDLGKMRGDVLAKLFVVAQRLSGLSQEDTDDLGKPSTSPATLNTRSSRSVLN